MNIKNLHPDFPHSDPNTGFQVLLRNLIMRTNFVPGVRYVIGWRGVKDSSFDVEGWTAKIKGMPGVFGIYFDSAEVLGEWERGRFMLNYFPHPDEELIDSFSIEAGIQTQQKDYYSKIRRFLQDPALCELFNIGVINLGIHRSENMLSLGLESLSRQRIIAKNGVTIHTENEPVEVVKPGDCDQDFPAYHTVFQFFTVLASSLTFNMESAPGHLSYITKPGSEIVYTSAGDSWEEPAEDLVKEYLYLTYANSEVNRHNLEKIIPEINNEECLHWFSGKELLTEYQNELWWKSDKIGSYNTLDKKVLGIDDRPELILVTGFLGAGKTSFLQNFIEYQVGMNRFVAVIQNEIGEVGLDGKLLDQDFAVTEIDEGCICCTLVGNIKNAINGILTEFHPDYIILETTGLANPYNLFDELEELDDLVRFDCVTTVVDALNIDESFNNYEVAVNQVKAADILLLNKKDLLAEDELELVMDKLRTYNSAAPIIAARHGDVSPALLYGDTSERKKDESHDEGGSQSLHCHEHCHDDRNHHSHTHDSLSSLKVEFNKPIDQEVFCSELENLSDKVFRVKGIVELKGKERPVLVQYVAGRYELSEYPDPNYEERFLIIIGQDLDAEFSREAFLV